MITKRDKKTDVAERDSDNQYLKDWAERAEREAPFEGEIDPASMVISPHTKPLIESETKIIGAHAGDPRSISPLAVDTPTEGTETPWRDTPPTNVSSVYETDNDHSPPNDPNTDPEDLHAMPEEDVPPEGGETRSAVEVFPPERDSRMQPAPTRKAG